MAASQAARLAAWQPATPAALATYLSGKWHLVKAMEYVRGGVTSTFSGDAEFQLLRARCDTALCGSRHR